MAEDKLECWLRALARKAVLKVKTTKEKLKKLGLGE